MEIKRYEPNGRFAKVVEYGDMLYISGITAMGDTIEEQTANVLAKIEEILNKYGSDKEHIISNTVYLKNIGDFTAMNSVYDKWVAPNAQPARACVEAALAAPAILIEIVCTAVKK